MSGDAVAAEVAPAPPVPWSGPRLGAIAPPAGKMVISAGAGIAILLPQLTLEGRIGLGESTAVDVRYRNLGIFGHLAQTRFTWAMPLGSRVTFGLAARTGIGTLGLGSGDSARLGIDLSGISLGNDWEVGHDFLLTWSRPGRAHVSASLGPTYALAGPRYTTYDDKKWKWDAHWQDVTMSLLGEWELSESRRFFIRLDGQFLIKEETVPYGFLPTLTLGHAWST
jgi:hypothetical protein